jgi:predicted small metal-binding protein
VFFCEDVLVCGCPAELREETDEALLREAAAHARRLHGIRYLDEGVMERVRAAIITR